MVASYSPRVRLAPLTTTASPAIAAAVAVGSSTTSSATRTPSQSHLKPFPWSFLPPELRLNILAHLPISDVKSCSLASHETHSLCVGVLFRVRFMTFFYPLLSTSPDGCVSCFVKNISDVYRIGNQTTNTRTSHSLRERHPHSLPRMCQRTRMLHQTCLL